MSRLALGSAWFDGATYGDVVAALDAFVELGGNVIDTGENYGNAERIIGRWLKESRRRTGLVISTKGAHPYDGRSRVTRDDIDHDLTGSLERLGLDSVELYLLHRDDPSVPVGEILDVLNGHLEAGRFRAFGASNWSTSRLDEAAAYAIGHGIRGFSCSSPNVSLARWTTPPWEGVVSASDVASRAWYERRQLPLIAWSPQSAGYFAVRDPARLDGDARRVIGLYDTPDNRERRRRASVLGDARGYTAGEVALAWVLSQPFPTIAVVGGRTPAELRSNARALSLELDADEVAWLDLESDRAPKDVVAN